MIESKTRNWLLLLLGIYLVVPSVHYFPFYPNIVLSWFGFDWYPSQGWVVFIQYAFVGVPAFIYIGLATLLPFFLLALIFLPTKSKRRNQLILCLAASLLLLAIYLNGWLLYTWPWPYQPVQTLSIALFTVLAYKAWRQTRLSTTQRLVHR